MEVLELQQRDETGAEDGGAPVMEEGAYSSDDFEDDAQDGVYGGEDGADEAPEDPDSELITLQEACARMVQDLQALRDETCALRGPVPPGKGGTRTDGAKEKKNPSQSIMAGKGLEAAINAIRVRHPTAIIFSGGSRKPQEQPRKALPCPEGREGGEVRLEACSQRKQPQCFSFGPPRPTTKDNRPSHAPPACPSVKRKRACPGTASHVAKPAEGCDVCELCDDSCWWGCGCMCHEGCALEEQDGRMSPVKSQAPKAEGTQAKGPSRSGFSFGKAPRTLDHRTTAAAAIGVVDTSGALKYIKPRIKGGAWGKPAVNKVPEKQAAPEPPPKPSTEPLTRPPGEDDMMISEAQEANGLAEAPQPVKEGQKQAPPPCTTNTDAVLSTRARAPCVVMAPPPCATKGKPTVFPHCAPPGPGQYDVHDVFGGWRAAGAVRMATASSDHQHSYPFELMMARRQVEMQVGGPGYYHAEQALDALRPRQPSLRLFAAPPPRKDRDTADVMEIEEKAGSGAEEEARPQAESKTKTANARSRSCKGLKDWGEEEWSSDGDRKGSASTLSCYESKWTDSEDEGKDDKPSRRRKKPPPTAAAPQKPGAKGKDGGPTGAEPGRFVGHRVRGFRMGSDTCAGLSWRNRVAIARAREERNRPRRVFGYDVRREAVDRRVAGGASFAAQAAARQREESRRDKHGGLAQKKAMEARCLAARADFLGPQLSHAWVPEDEARRPRKEEEEGARREGHRAVMEGVRAFGKARQRAAKPVPRYRPEAELEQRAALARAIREAAQRRTQDAWLQPQLQSQWGDPATATEGVPVFEKRPGRETLRVRRKGAAEVADFNAPVARNSDPMGPGFYDVAAGGLGGSAAGGPDFDKMRSREESRGPFGERAAAEEREAREAGEGDCLILAPDKNVVKKRVKAFSFSKLGEGPTKPEQGPREGDILELDLDRRPGEERRGGRLVAWNKVQGREEQRGGGEEDDDGHHGDVLILEPQPEVREKRVVARSFGKTDRWQQAPAKDDQSEELVLDDNVLARKAVIKTGPSMAKQAGRWDKQEEEEALRRQSRRDEADGAKFEMEREMEADAAIQRAQEYLGGRGVARAGLSMGQPPPQEPTLHRKTADDTEATASALQAERERAVAVEKAQQNALSNKSKRVTGFSMGKQSGRPSDSEAVAAPEELPLKDGETLILSPRAEATSRFKRKPGKGVLTWNRMVERFTTPTQVAAPAEADHGPSSPKLPVSLLSRVASFASQSDRPLMQAPPDKTDAPDGQRLILSPRDQATRPRVTGGAAMKQITTEPRARRTPAPKTDRQPLSKTRGSTESLDISLGSSLAGEPVQAAQVSKKTAAPPSAPAAAFRGDALDDQSVKDGERLILSPRAEASSRFRDKPGKGVLTWNRSAERFASPTQDARPTSASRSDRQAAADDERNEAPDGQRLILSPRFHANRPRITGGAAMKQTTTEPRARPTSAPKTERRPLAKARGSTDSLDISLGSSLLEAAIQAPRVMSPPPAAPAAVRSSTERSGESTKPTSGNETHKVDTRQEGQAQSIEKGAVSAPDGVRATQMGDDPGKPLPGADAGKREPGQAPPKSVADVGGVEGGAVADLLQQLWDLEI